MRVEWAWLAYALLLLIHSKFWRQVRSLFQNEFSIAGDLELPLSISCILSFPKGHPVAAYVFLLVFLSLLPTIYPSTTCFIRQFLSKIWTRTPLQRHPHVTPMKDRKQKFPIMQYIEFPLLPRYTWAG